MFLLVCVPWGGIQINVKVCFLSAHVKTQSSHLEEDYSLFGVLFLERFPHEKFICVPVYNFVDDFLLLLHNSKI